MPKEIERKFLLDVLPNHISTYQCFHIEQGYISVALDGTEVRVRRKDTQCFLTVKKGNGGVREETEIEISASQFVALWPLTEGRRIEKNRYSFAAGIEVDVYQGTLAPLIVAEIEFDSLEGSKTYKVPPWFGKEVTDDNAYKNRTLALYGLPNGRGRVCER